MINSPFSQGSKSLHLTKTASNTRRRTLHTRRPQGSRHKTTRYKTWPHMFVHLLKTLLLWNGSKALKDIVQVDNKWCIPTPKSPDCNQISNLKRSASWIGSEFQDIGCLEFQSRNTRNVSRKGKKMTRKNSFIVRKKDWIGGVKVLWNKTGTCIFAYLPKICKPPAMHFTSFCIELKLNIHSPIAQETPRSSILVQHHASSKSFLARRKGNLFSYLTRIYQSILRPQKGKCFLLAASNCAGLTLSPWFVGRLHQPFQP